MTQAPPPGDGPPAASDPPGPSAVLPPLDEDDLRALSEAGRRWAGPPTDIAGPPALPLDPSLGSNSADPQPSRFVRLVPVSSAEGQPEELEATSVADSTVGRPGRR